MRLCGKERQVLIHPQACWDLFPHFHKGGTTGLTCSGEGPGGVRWRRAPVGGQKPCPRGRSLVLLWAPRPGQLKQG